MYIKIVSYFIICTGLLQQSTHEFLGNQIYTNILDKTTGGYFWIYESYFKDGTSSNPNVVLFILGGTFRRVPQRIPSNVSLGFGRKAALHRLSGLCVTQLQRIPSNVTCLLKVLPYRKTLLRANYSVYHPMCNRIPMCC